VRGKYVEPRKEFDMSKQDYHDWTNDELRERLELLEGVQRLDEELGMDGCAYDDLQERLDLLQELELIEDRMGTRDTTNDDLRERLQLLEQVEEAEEAEA
jgi:hypothetical protein